MTIPVLTFFNNKGGVGKTSLVYHLAWMMSEIGHRVLACDLDPQANLTSMFLSEDKLEGIYADDYSSSAANTVFRCVRPLMQVGDLHSPELQHITSTYPLSQVIWNLQGSRIRCQRSGRTRQVQVTYTDRLEF